MLNAFYNKGKPYFFPGSDTNISYDSLLGISLTLHRDTACNVYLDRYKKTRDYIEVVLSTDSDIIASVYSKVLPGIQNIQIEQTDQLLSGNLTIIDTVVEEISEKRVQISPMYIHYANLDEHNKSYIYIDNTPIPFSTANFVFDDLNTDVNIITDDTEITAEITFTAEEDTIIALPEPDYIKIFNGSSIGDGSEGLLVLPEGFVAKKINDQFATISVYTHETCPTSQYNTNTLGAINCNINHSDEGFLPLDVCFELIDNTQAPEGNDQNDLEDNKDDPWRLNPYRIDTLEAVEGVNYLDLNPLHDNNIEDI